MFTILGFAFDWAIIFALIFETIGCGIGCCILRSSGPLGIDARSDEGGFATGTVWGLFTVVGLGILGYWNHFSLTASFWWCWANWLTFLSILSGYILVGMIASLFWLGGWMKERVAKFKEYRCMFLGSQGIKMATSETPIGGSLAKEWGTRLNCYPDQKALGELPPFASYRAYLGRRIAWWPLYLVNWVLCDLLFDFLNTISRLMANFADLFRKFYEQFTARYLRELIPNETTQQR